MNFREEDWLNIETLSENSCSESSSGQGMGKIGENFGVEPDKSQK